MRRRSDSRNRAMAACDQLDTDVLGTVRSLELEVLCAFIENVTMISDHACDPRTRDARIMFVGDAEMWRFVAACAIVRLNEELARRHDQEVGHGDK